MDIPVYLITGFLESGKTTFINETISDPDFSQGERTLLLCCEEGEVEYDLDFLKSKKVSLVKVEDKEELTEEFLKKCQAKYKPQRVLIEYNGMWDFSAIFDLAVPRGWITAQIITTVDATTFNVYVNNMRSIMSNQMSDSDLIIFNRCDENTDRLMFRRNVKILNRRAQLIYEDKQGNIMDEMSEILPFDINAEEIEIVDDDYGIWYLDASENPMKYEGKTVKIKGMVYQPPGITGTQFVTGRYAMTCCADDMASVGFICDYELADKLEQKTWVNITAKIKNEYHPGYQSNGPILYVEDISKANQPEEPIVYFN